MSLLNPKPDNPVKKYYEWKSDDKCFAYYDKEKKESVKAPLPIKFICLDEFSTVKGFNPNSETNIYSNEVFDLSKEVLNVKAFNTNLLISGLWKDIKDRVTAEGGKFCKSVYAVIFDADNYEVVNFQLKGAGLSWISKNFNPDKFSIVVEKFETGKKGKIEYTLPVFEKGFEITDSIRQRLTPVATDLNNYLQSRKLSHIESEIHTEPEETNGATQEYVPEIVDSNRRDEDVIIEEEPLPF